MWFKEVKYFECKDDLSSGVDLLCVGSEILLVLWVFFLDLGFVLLLDVVWYCV